jgi:DASH complex subunit DAM1
METIIDGIMNARDQTVKCIPVLIKRQTSSNPLLFIVPDLIKPPDLNQARVNKCLIALVNRKVVRKETSSGTALYHWRGLP